MPTQVVSVRYSKPGTQPPVYLAGSFTEPPWRVQEMEHTVLDNNEFDFHKEVEVEAGKEYQYKLRVGEGDWWILNEDAPTVTDDIGNRNNLLKVPQREEPEAPMGTKMDAAEGSASTEAVSLPTRETTDAVPVEDTKHVEATGTPEEGLTKLPSDSLAHATEQAASETLDGTVSDGKFAGGASVEAPELHHEEQAATKTASEEPTQPSHEKAKGELSHSTEKELNDSTTATEEATTQGEASPTETEDGYVKVRRMSEVAAEVADSARNLDREQPTPPISDEEAGRIGYRRMSGTPIPEVANTAAEVADSAAILDKEHLPKLQMPQGLDESGYDSPDSGDETPFHERAPLFAHECIEPPSANNDYHFPETQQTTPPPVQYEEEAIDFNDPTLEEFPCERSLILETVRSLETSLNEDHTSVEGIPPSPVVGSTESNNHHPDRLDLPSPPANLAVLERSPSLNSIAEEEDGDEEPIASLPSAVNLSQITSHPRGTNGVSDAKENALPAKTPEPVVKPTVDIPESTPAKATENTEETPAEAVVTPFVVSDRQLGDNATEPQEIPTSKTTPDLLVTPATPAPTPKDPFELPQAKPAPVDTASSSATDQTDSSQVKARKQPLTSAAAAAIDRPNTQNSVRSAATGGDAKNQNFLRAFWRVVFVDWIGGLIMRLCGRRRT